MNVSKNLFDNMMGNEILTPKFLYPDIRRSKITCALCIKFNRGSISIQVI